MQPLSHLTQLLLASALLCTTPVFAAAVTDLDLTRLPIAQPTPKPVTQPLPADVPLPTPWEVKAPAGAPNVVIILLDDIGERVWFQRGERDLVDVREREALVGQSVLEVELQRCVAAAGRAEGGALGQLDVEGERGARGRQLWSTPCWTLSGSKSALHAGSFPERSRRALR